MIKKQKIFVCPLDWGIGHATRSVPVIRELISQQAEVLLGASGRSFDFLKREFPDLQMIDFPGYTLTYPTKGSMALMMLKQSPGLIREIKKEHLVLEELVNQYKFDAVISDNRYGAYSEKVPSVFMTHQLFIRTPAHLKVLEPVLYKMNQNYISRFGECWIPDFMGENNLSGELSHKKALPENHHFIGPLSRFSGVKAEKEEKLYDLLALISGPEPQRSIFEEKILRELKNSTIKAAVLSGKTESMIQSQMNDNIEIYSHLDTNSLYKLIHQSKVMLSRPGYSTLMDLAAIGAKAIFVPTPGQTEQEYLAEKMNKEGKMGYLTQKEFTLEKALHLATDFEGLKFDGSGDLLKKKIQDFLSRK